MTKQEAAQYLSISVKTLDRYCKKGMLQPQFKYTRGRSRIVVFNQQEVEQLRIYLYTPVEVKPKEIRPKDVRPKEKVMSKKTWVYLMKDLRSGFYKIGESINPQYRERTLQSEQPLIELIEAWLTTADEERILHRMYSEQRIRGEWFNLDKEDIQFITFMFYECPRFSTGKSEKQEVEDKEFAQQERNDALIEGAEWVDFVFEGYGYEF